MSGLSVDMPVAQIHHLVHRDRHPHLSRLPECWADCLACCVAVPTSCLPTMKKLMVVVVAMVVVSAMLVLELELELELVLALVPVSCGVVTRRRRRQPPRPSCVGSSETAQACRVWVGGALQRPHLPWLQTRGDAAQTSRTHLCS